MKNLVLYLPHLDKTLRERQTKELAKRLAEHGTSVCGYHETIPDGSVVLTDEAQLAFACFGEDVPCCVLLDGASGSESLPNGVWCVESLEDVSWELVDRVERRVLGLPWEITRTERLVLREMSVADVPRIYELYRGGTVTRYLEPPYESVEQEMAYTQDYIRNIYAYYGYGMWLIALRESGEVIGRAGLECREGTEGLELGFMLGERYWHKGYAYEACSAVLTYGRKQLGCRDYYARVHPDNAPSRHLCERLGMRADGTLDEQGYLVYRKRES